MNDRTILIAIKHALLGAFFWVAFGATPAVAAANGQPDTLIPQQAGEDWTCPMHAEIHRHEPGKCPLCKMKLVKAKPKNV